MCILNLGAAVAKIQSVASSSHAYRERVGGDRDHLIPQVRGGNRGVRGGDPCVGGDPGTVPD